MESLRNLQGDYLIVNDSSYLEKEPFQSFPKKQVGHYKGILVFDIR